MPELPEVETTTRGLRATVLGKKIQSFWYDWERSLLPTPKDFDVLLGSTIVSIERKGKNILIHLSNNHSLIVHLKMTGHLLYGDFVLENNTYTPKDTSSPLADPYNRFIHVVFSFTDDTQLAFCDVRKFGKIEILSTENINNHKRLRELGPEPISPAFVLEDFRERISNKNTPIKTVLLKQEVIAGVGNIYADESLHRSHITPTRKANSLTEMEVERLFNEIKTVLLSGIDFGGDSMSDYRNIYGERGEFSANHLVYRRTTKPCLTPSCKGTIQRIVLGGRGTHYCPVCQK